MQPTEEVTSIFRSNGLKVTAQRVAVFEALQGDESHPTAESIWTTVRSDLPNVSLRTIYQTLNELTSIGQLRACELGTGAMRFDPNLEPHHHLVCDDCGLVSDLHRRFDDVELDPVEGDGFVANAAEITFRGLCAACAG